MVESIIKVILCLAAALAFAYAYRFNKRGHNDKSWKGTIDVLRSAILVIVGATLICIVFTTSACAQNVIRKGNTFEQISTKQEKFAGALKTKYTYRDSNGVVYPIYISKHNKVFIIRTNKKGKKYPYYLKDIEEQILREYGRG
jgi:hypothetical protein